MSNPPDKVHRKGEWSGGGRWGWTLLAPALLIATVYTPMLLTGTRLADSEDFRILAARQEFIRKSALTFHCFPLRNPFFGGGYPSLSDPEDNTLQPLSWLLVPFPTPLALKVRAWLCAVLGGVGTFLLARRELGFGGWGASFAALLFSLSLWLPERVASGNPTETLLCLVPWCLWLILSVPRRPRRFPWLPLLLYIILADGKQSLLAALVFMGLVCAGWSLLPPAGPRRARFRVLPVLVLVLAVGFAALVAMARVLPVLEVIRAHGGVWGLNLRRDEAGRAYAFLSPSQALEGMLGLKGLLPGAEALYVGPMGLAGLVLGLLLAPRRAAVWAGSAVVLLWAGLGPGAPLNLLGLLQRLPLGGALDRPLKYFAPLVVLGIALGAGVGFDCVRFGRGGRPTVALRTLLLIALLADLLPAGILLTTTPFTVPAPPSDYRKPVDFYSVRGRGLPRSRLGPPEADTYFNLCRNVGTIDWYAAVPLGERAQPRFFVDRLGRRMPNPSYRGEAYFLGRSGVVSTLRLSPNRIELDLVLQRPDLLVVNQNYHPAWRASEGVLGEHEGLLAVRLGRAGRHRIVLRYWPRPFGWGLLLSGLGVVALIIFTLLLVGGKVGWLCAGRGVPLVAEEGRRGWRGWLAASLFLVAAAWQLAGPGREDWATCYLVREADRYYLHRRYLRAADLYRRALRRDDSRGEVWVGLGRALEGAGRWDEALGAYRSALQRAPGCVAVYDRLAAALVRQGRYAEAVGVLRRGLRAAPGEVVLLERLISLLAAAPDAEVRDGREAVRLAEQLLRCKGGGDATVLDLLAGAYAEVGQFVRAVQAARRALALAEREGDPERVRAIRQRLRLYRARLPFRLPRR